MLGRACNPILYWYKAYTRKQEHVITCKRSVWNTYAQANRMQRLEAIKAQMQVHSFIVARMDTWLPFVLAAVYLPSSCQPVVFRNLL